MTSPKGSLTRRRLIWGGAATAAGAAGLTLATSLANRHGLVPPYDHSPYSIGETLTYAAQRLLMARHPLAREFSASEISTVAPVKGKPPQTDPYLHLAASSFADWRFGIGGLVAYPRSFSMPELKCLPMRSQITLHACEEGWSYIAQWSGISLAYLLNLAGVSAKAKYVVFYCYDGWWGSIDMEDAWHPQTLLALVMNGQDLSIGHGAPLRLRVARQMGYKSFKYLSHMAVVEDLKSIGNGLADFSVGRRYAWYAGI